MAIADDVGLDHEDIADDPLDGEVTIDRRTYGRNGKATRWLERARQFCLAGRFQPRHAADARRSSTGWQSHANAPGNMCEVPAHHEPTASVTPPEQQRSAMPEP